MFTSWEYSSLLAPLLAYLVARALAFAVERVVPRGGTATLVALGAAYAALASRADPALLIAPVTYWPLADSVSFAALAALGSEAARSRGGARPFAPSGRNRLRSVAAFATPLLAGLAIALGFGVANASSAWAIARTALVLAAALWLSSDAKGPGLVAGGVAIALLSRPGPDAGTPGLLAVGFLAALAVSGGIVKGDLDEKGGGFGRALRSVAPALALGLAWALRTVGLPWPAAGLASGFALGLSRRFAEGNAPGARELRSSAASTTIVAETGDALAFVAGLSFSLPGLEASIPAIALIAASILAAAALRTAVAGSSSPYLPVEAAAFAALIAAKRAGLVSDAAIAGAAIAYALAAPFSLAARSFPGQAAAAPIKALVGVSLAGSSLGELSFASAIGSPGEPIRAACVAVRDGGPGPSDAEAALVRCVAAGAAADIRVLPSVVAAASVASGLARAARERRADAVVMGLGRGPLDDGTKHALRALIDAFPGAVVGLRGTSAFASSKRLFALAVSGVVAAPGFVAALEAASRAWGRPVRAIEALMIGAPAAVLVEAADGLLDERSTISVPSWRDVPSALDARASQNASFVVFSSRPGDRAWNPGHERLPVVLEAAFPGSPLALWFLPLAEAAPVAAAGADRAPEPPGPRRAESEPGSAGPAPAAPATEADQSWPPIVATAYESGRVFTDMREAALVDAIRRLTDSVLPGSRGPSGRLAAEFSAVARKEPIELSPGVLLLHAHAAGVSLPTLAIGARPSGWPLLALSAPVTIVVALVSPVEAGPETHLEALTQIASAFRNLGLADSLLAPPPSA